MNYEQLKLSNQICFPVYAASRLIIREYKPYLDKIGITYPQYLVFLVLWETNNLSVNEITDKLILNTNTLTPLLKRMEALGFISRKRSDSDERKVIVGLTEKGKRLKKKAASVPEKLATVLKPVNLTSADLDELRNKLNTLVEFLNKKNKTE
jgi:MarR family transcriptional regulator, organic hydroperoxide resistance regulator